jgi:ornithine cyclodeaminase/alanine dehydrogenase-like protein (mu-crystallin family)
MTLESLLWLNESDVERLLDLDELCDALADGFRAMSAGDVQGPARPEIVVPKGYLLSMPAYRTGSLIGVKMVSVFHGNADLGVPGHLALICLFDPETGATKAIMDGTYITATRTAGASAVSAQLLARADARVLAVVGAGVQGRSHIKLLSRVRPIEEIRVVSLRFEDAQAAAHLDPRASALQSYEEAIRGADIVALCTTSEEPVIHCQWLKPGAHVTSVGYMPPGSELDPRLVESSRIFVETRMAFEDPPAGCVELKGRDPALATELGEVILGRGRGRVRDDEITVYKAMGHAIEDLVAAELVYRTAVRERSGMRLQQYGAMTPFG